MPRLIQARQLHVTCVVFMLIAPSSIYKIVYPKDAHLEVLPPLHKH